MSTKATKTLEAAKSNYVVVQFGYDNKIVLPFDAAQALFISLEKAKRYKDPYNQEIVVTDLNQDDVKISFIGAQEYGEACLRGTILAEVSS